MTAPAWMVAAIRDFGRSAGLSAFEPNDRGAAAVRFENGAELRFECAGEELVMALAIPSDASPAAARRILTAAHPEARRGIKIRAAYLEKTGRAVFAVRFNAAETTLPRLDAAFGTLWRIAADLGGSSWP